MRLIRRLKRNEEGYTMIAAVGATLLVTVLVSGSLAAVEGDLRLTKSDQDHKRAYEAAVAGLGDYSFHLNKDNGVRWPARARSSTRSS
jgi:Tfp pilus assembly protein PilX